MILRALLVASFLLPLLACESENRIACEQYLTYFNALPCAQGLDSGIECEASADHPCDLGPYFACLEEGQTCVNDTLSTNVAACAELLNCAAN